MPLMRISKWQWVPVERPVLPALAICWPLYTFCPLDTSREELWP